jgi:hypothetical protein
MKKILMVSAATVALGVACGDATESGGLSADNQQPNTAAIQSWETHDDNGLPVLRALDERGALVAEMHLIHDAAAEPGASVALSFSVPRSGEVKVSRDGSIEGDVDAQLLEIADAAFRAFPSVEPGTPALDADGSVEKSTDTGSFRKVGGLFGTSGDETVGTLCPPGETRRAARVDEIDEPLFGGSCDREGFRTSNENDCRIKIGYSVEPLSAVRCEWEVTSR